MSDAPPLPSREGELLAGKYQLEKLLGSGGMGQVYRAQNVLIGRQVAIKVLNQEQARNAEVARRFLREARAANLVRHPNVVDVLDMGQDEAGTPFIVQELFHGQDLDAQLVDFGGRLPLDVVLKILMPVIDAVAFAHTKGVVHRDLKPGNIFLAREGGKIVPKLLDFGISHIATGDPRMTTTGSVMGTPAYMSPEQVQGDRHVDARTDVWALGILLYEVTSGEMPFEADTYSALAVKIATLPPAPLESLVAAVPPDFARIVQRCLRKDREERYPSAVELARDLRNLEAGKPLEDVSSLAPSTLVVAPAGRPPELNDEQRVPVVVSAPTLQAVAANLPDLELPPPRPRKESRSYSGEDADLEPSVPRIEVAQPRSGRISAVSAAPPSGHDRFEDDPGPEVALKLDESFRPPPSTGKVLRRTLARPQAASFDSKRLVGLAVSGIAVIVALAVLTAVNPVPGGWPVIAWSAGVYRDLSDLTCGAFGVAFAIGAVMLIVRSLRAMPVSWGGAIASGGLAMLACFAAAPLLGYADPTGRVPMLVPLGVALLPLGVAVAGAQGLLEDWLRESDERRWASIAMAAFGLFAAIQVVRAADVQPPPRSAPAQAESP